MLGFFALSLITSCSSFMLAQEPRTEHSLQGQAVPEQQRKAAREWAMDRVDEFRVRLFGDPQHWTQIRNELGADLTIAIRVTGDDTRDTQVAAWLRGSELLRLDLTMVRERTLVDQLESAYLKCPGCMDYLIYEKLNVDKLTPTISQTRKAAGAFNEFRGLCIPGPPRPDMVLHGIVLDVWTKSIVNESHFLSFAGRYSPMASDRTDVIERWYMNVFKALEINPTLADRGMP